MNLYETTIVNSEANFQSVGLHIALRNLPEETQTIKRNLNEIWAFDEKNRLIAVIKEVKP